MSRMRVALVAVMALATTAALAPRRTAAEDQAPSFHVIGNPNTTDTAVSPEDLARIFLGRKTLWSGGTRAVPCFLGEATPAGQAFLEDVLHRTPLEYRTHWRRTLLSGGGTPPRVFKTPAQLVDFVARQPGAVGVVDAPVDDPRVVALTLTE